LPTETGSDATDLNSSRPFVGIMARKSWFTMSQKETLTEEARMDSPQISLSSATSLSPGTTADAEDEAASDDDKSYRSLKVIKPTPAWKLRLNGWFGTSRWTYRQCVDLVKARKVKAWDLKGLRNRVVHENNYGRVKVNKGARGRRKRRKRAVYEKAREEAWKQENGKKRIPQVVRDGWKEEEEKLRASPLAWVLETPSEIRDSAVRDFNEAYKSNVEKKKKNPRHHWKYSYRTKKDRLQTIKIPGKCVNSDGTMFPTFTNKEPLLSTEGPVSVEGNAELQIHRDRMGNFYATILRSTVPVPFDATNKDLRVCALDPGVRTFNTVYDSQGTVTELAPNDIGRIYRLCYYLDDMQKRMKAPDVRSKKRCRMRKAWLRGFKRIRNLVYVHKAAKFLCDNYDMVFLPAFNSQSMVKKKRAYRRIGSKTARAMMTWSHYRFRQILIAKAVEAGTKVVLVTEEYTSKTCGACGHVHHELGSAKVFHCPTCGFTIGRDINGARNILLKSLHEHHELGSAKVFHCPTCGFTIGRDINGARNILLKSLHEHHLMLVQHVRR